MAHVDPGTPSRAALRTAAPAVEMATDTAHACWVRVDPRPVALGLEGNVVATGGVVPSATTAGSGGDVDPVCAC